MTHRPRVGLWLGAAILMAIGIAVEHGGSRAPAAPSTLFAQANESYRHGHYPRSLELYTTLLAQGMESGPLYYNLGNALLKNGQPAEALWAYLNAQRLTPRDPDLRANLAAVRLLLSDAAAASITTPRLGRLLTFNGCGSLQELAGATLMALWVSILCWMGWAWVMPIRRGLGPVAAIATLLLAAALAALIAQTYQEQGRPAAVVIAPTAQVRFAPEASGTVYFTLPEGAVVERLATLELSAASSWVQVRRADGRAGWVSAASLHPL
ncbi:MAG: tetratricopeptide repeat protein [Candidatus Omnitrophica bacterium]|nr:tetratricopeptide repeat protein [Candidatus Omnitrophota bacterium]